MSFGVGIHSHEEIELLLRNFDCHIEVARFKVRIEGEIRFFGFEIFINVGSFGEDSVNPFINWIGVVVGVILMKNIRVALPWP